MRHWFLVLSALFVSTSVISLATPTQAQNIQPALKQQKTPPRSPARSEVVYMQAMNTANAAINSCYENGNLEDCDKVNRIINTLQTWCSQGDNNACITAKNVIGFEGLAQSAQTARQLIQF